MPLWMSPLGLAKGGGPGQAARAVQTLVSRLPLAIPEGLTGDAARALEGLRKQVVGMCAKLEKTFGQINAITLGNHSGEALNPVGEVQPGTKKMVTSKSPLRARSRTPPGRGAASEEDVDLRDAGGKRISVDDLEDHGEDTPMEGPADGSQPGMPVPASV